jgi:fused signal recognition particle receptor
MGFWDGLSKTRDKLKQGLAGLFRSEKEGEAYDLKALEEILLQADFGPRTTAELLTRLQGSRDLAFDLRNQIIRILTLPPPPLPARKEDEPLVIFMVGVNGVGKTTTIAKLAHLYRQRGEKVILAAGDTYRAAASDQLQIWAGRAGAEIIIHNPGGDPAAVIFDALKAARARRSGVVIVDTAGRLHTRVQLMDELKKLRRIADREVPGAPHEVFLVLDATLGQNSLVQARVFLEVAGVTGVIIAKLDGTARGGMAVAVAEELKIPIRYAGMGERLEDLAEFSPEDFARALIPEEKPEPGTPEHQSTRVPAER